MDVKIPYDMLDEPHLIVEKLNRDCENDDVRRNMQVDPWTLNDIITGHHREYCGNPHHLRMCRSCRSIMEELKFKQRGMDGLYAEMMVLREDMDEIKKRLGMANR